MEWYYQRALEIYQTELGPDDPNVNRIKSLLVCDVCCSVCMFAFVYAGWSADSVMYISLCPVPSAQANCYLKQGKYKAAELVFREVGWLTSIRTVQFSVLLCHPSSLHRTPISPLPSHVTPRHPTFFNLQILQTANSSEPSDGEHTGPPSSWMLDSDSPAQEHRSAASDAVMDTSYSDKGGWHRSERQVGGR